ncbi:hypothetical protein MVEN_00029300 [Mycena venus]|uniref:Uncharacterized protein n=1 Tax=Mycena venus TaxID=2733690 RepID=A0A8H7DGU7_9AGAR|nr:hypothetical protein MVEN_00029300 [Mycena venus]
MSLTLGLEPSADGFQFISCWMTFALVAGCIDCGRFGFRRVVRFAAGIHAGSSESESAVCPQPLVSNAWGDMVKALTVYSPPSCDLARILYKSDDEFNTAFPQAPVSIDDFQDEKRLVVLRAMYRRITELEVQA